MSSHATTSHRRFVRDADRAMLAGVCAGIADYFGFNLRVTRLLAIIAFFVAMPFTLIVYFAIVCLVPAESYRRARGAHREYRPRRRRLSRRERRQAEEESRDKAREDFDQQCEALDERLATIEKYVTSSRYELDREFEKL